MGQVTSQVERHLLLGSLDPEPSHFAVGTIERTGLFPKISPPVESALFLDFAEPLPAALNSPWSSEDIATMVGQRLAPLALRLVSENRCSVPNESVARLQAASFAGAYRALQVVRASSEALDSLRRHHIMFAISKGPGIALETRNPVERPFSDLDVLVAPADFNYALSVLASVGYEEDVSSRPPWPWFNRWCREAVNLRSPLGGSVDVHHHLPPWLWTHQIDIRAVIAAQTERRFYGHDLPLLSAPQNLLIVALHVVSDHSRPGQTLMVWRDLLTLAAVCDPDEVLDLAEEHKLVGWLRWVIGELPPQVRPSPLWERLRAYHDHPAKRFRLRHLLPPAFGSRHILGQALRLPIPQSSCFLASMAVPSPGFLRARFPGSALPYFPWWRSSLRGILRPGQGPAALFPGKLMTTRAR